MKDEGKPIDIIAVADVYEKNRAKNAKKPHQGQAGRGRLPQGPSITRTLTAVRDRHPPDHWHAKMRHRRRWRRAKDRLLRKRPMTHTIDEARKVAEAVKKTKQIMTVGVQSTSDPALADGQRADHCW